MQLLAAMGSYLSQPLTAKDSSDGASRRLRFGASSMQGWRKNQEDAHIALPSLGNGSTQAAAGGELSRFAVFDGHGGREVSAFCEQYMPAEVLARFGSGEASGEASESAGGGGGDSGGGGGGGGGTPLSDLVAAGALCDAFHSLDRKIHSGDHRVELKRWRRAGGKDDVSDSDDDDGGGKANPAGGGPLPPVTAAVAAAAGGGAGGGGGGKKKMSKGEAQAMMQQILQMRQMQTQQAHAEKAKAAKVIE